MPRLRTVFVAEVESLVEVRGDQSHDYLVTQAGVSEDMTRQTIPFL